MSFNPSNFGFDISYYQATVNFATMKAYGAKFVILRCGYALTKDTRFDEYMGGVNGVLPFEVYHYYDPIFSPGTQADRVIAILQNYKPLIRRVWLDLEFGWTGNYTAPQHWLTYRNAIEAAGYKTGIYTRKSWWDDKVGTFAGEFAKRPLWAAQYNTALTLIPKGWDKAMIWQNGTPAIGHAAGVSSAEIDHDIWNDAFDFVAEWGVDNQPPADVINEPHPGMTRVSGTRNGWTFELFTTDPAKCDYEVVCSQPLETVSAVARRKGATLGVNGGEWDRVSAPKDYTVSNGFVCHYRLEPVPSLMVMIEGFIKIDHAKWDGVRQAISGLRYLIQNGQIKSYLSGTEPQYTEGHARSIHGVKANGFHMVMQSEGVYPNQGLTLKQAAEIMQQYGAVTAFDSGGGGDVTCVLDGQSLIVPENIDTATGLHFERPLPSVFLVYAKDGTMANGTAKEKLGNTSTVRKTPSRYGADTGDRISPYNIVTFAEEVPVTVQGTADNAADRWLKLGEARYVNYILAGKEYYTILTQPTTDPTPGLPDLPISFTAGDDVTYVKQTVNIVLKPK